MLGAAGCWKGTGSKRPRLKVHWYLKTQDTCPSIFFRHQCKSSLLGSYIEVFCPGECLWRGRKACSNYSIHTLQHQPASPKHRAWDWQQEKDLHSWPQQLLSYCWQVPAAPYPAPAPPQIQPAQSGLPVPRAGTQDCNAHTPCPGHSPGAGTASLQPCREQSAQSPRLLPLQKAALGAGKWDAPTSHK